MHSVGMRRHRHVVLAAATIATSVVLAGCGGSPSGGGDEAAAETGSGSDVIAQAEELSGQEQVDFLVDAAKKEGGPLRFYTSWSSNAIDTIVDAFEKQYGIEVEAYRASSQDLSLRISQETSAGFDEGADLVEMRGQELFQFSQDGSLQGFQGDSTRTSPTTPATGPGPQTDST